MRNPMIGSPMVNRNMLGEILSEALSQLTNKTGESDVLAAALAARIRDVLRIRLENPDVTLNGSFFGPVLYGQNSPKPYPDLKFHHFLAAFPDVAEGYYVGSVQRVRVAKPRSVIMPTNGVKAAIEAAEVTTAYLIVDSPSVLDRLHHILGTERPTLKTLPNWDILQKYLQTRFPAKEWKGRFFMGLGGTRSEGAASFQHWLTTVGFKVVPLQLKQPPSVMDDTVSNERSKVTASAVSQLLREIRNSGNVCHILVATHSQIIAGELACLLRDRKSDVQIGVIGFPELMAPEIMKLREDGLTVIDIETDAGMFKAKLPRRHVISPNEFDPTAYL